MNLMSFDGCYNELLCDGKSVTAWNRDINDLVKAGQVIFHEGMRLHVTEANPVQKLGVLEVQRLSVKAVGRVKG